MKLGKKNGKNGLVRLDDVVGWIEEFVVIPVENDPGAIDPCTAELSEALKPKLLRLGDLVKATLPRDWESLAAKLDSAAEALLDLTSVTCLFLMASGIRSSLSFADGWFSRIACLTVAIMSSLAIYGISMKSHQDNPCNAKLAL
uniref:Uncharacterized protein n=1 Tax=Moorena producens (strain JHB) TaxID=1454205 RepID=A0A1D9FWJ4_MOOP1